eukprot:GFUD01038074.1.p1 GENE.GFUD01038074.1~~GFUD01038074.1.p1  ORF type:complete len:372 (-),score=115.55 GFUD01038074.1:39-1154(-)
MPGITDNSRSVRRCKACQHPVKGHPGPFGLARCRNMEDDGKKKTDNGVEEEIVELISALEAVDVNSEATDNLKPTTEKEETNYKILKPVADEAVDVNSETTDTSDDLPPSTGKEDSNSRILKQGIDEAVAVNSEATDTSEDLEPTTEKEETNSSVENELVYSSTKKLSGNESESEDSCFLSDQEDFAQKIDDIVARLEESLIETGEEESDHPAAPLDIRSVLSGGQFCICHCPPATSDMSLCRCEGELLLDCKLAGEVRNIYLDPSRDFLEDLKPRVKCNKEGWNKDNPSRVELGMVGVVRKGVVIVEGKICLEALLVKGEEGCSGVIRGTMWLVMEVGEEFEKRGLKSPVSYKPVQFQLVRLEELERDDQ